MSADSAMTADVSVNVVPAGGSAPHSVVAPSDNGSDGPRIQSIAAETIVVPLPRPLQLGPMFIREREYTIVKVVTTEQIVGCAYVNARGAPVAAMVNTMIAPALVGEPSEAIDAAYKLAQQRNIAAGRVGAFMRALSIVDIALWDAKGKRAGMPVWRLLGGGSSTTDCMFVGGYPTGEAPQEMAERLGDLATSGHRLIKVARSSSPLDFREFLRSASAAVGDSAQLVIDTHWCWNRADEAIREIGLWEITPTVAWVEDPLAPENVDAYARLVSSGVAPIGVGDELTDRHAAYGLLSRASVDVLRIDATTIGGITGAWHMTNVAQAAGTRVSYHVYPEVHVQLAAAGGADGLTETFGSRDNPFDPAQRLYEGGPVYGPGTAIATDSPGIGIELDEEFVTAHLLGGNPPREQVPAA